MYSFSSLAEFATLREGIKADLIEIFQDNAHRIFVAINEGVNNAIFHGNKEDSSKKVFLTINATPNEFRVVIRDEGQGFANQETTEIAPCFAEHGRGLLLIQHYVDSYQFNNLGNEITLIKKIDIA